ncbi:hypothetical protein N431DRAFT_94594 [Stipitochalara longipes BDJ]|nr:hypothetical protein N431DRAFT_94594 [Stipitochalara longipes BDJ]
MQKWRCRSNLVCRSIEQEREGRYLQERCRCAALFSRMPCALLLSSSMNNRLAFCLSSIVWSSAGGGRLRRGWLGSGHAKQRLERGGRSAGDSPDLAQGSGQGRQPRGPNRRTSADRRSSLKY